MKVYLKELNEMRVDFAKYGNCGGNGNMRLWWRDLKYQLELSEMCGNNSLQTLEEIYFTLKHKIKQVSNGVIKNEHVLKYFNIEGDN